MSEPCQIQAADGYALSATLYDAPAGRANAVLIVNGATGVHRRFYDRFATHMADCGFSTLTYDYRGMGESRLNPHGLPVSMAAWGNRDLVGVLDFARTIGRGLPIYVMGHSVGGQIVGLAANNDLVEGIVTLGAQSGYYKLWPAGARTRMAFNWHVLIPTLVGIFGELPGWAGTGQSLPGDVAKQWARWCRDPRFLFGEVPSWRLNFESVTAPMLVMGVETDPFAPPAAVDAFAAFYPRAAVERRTLHNPQLGHFDYFRPKNEKLWGAVVDWLNGLAETRKEAA